MWSQTKRQINLLISLLAAVKNLRSRGMKNIQYGDNQHNINRMVQVERQKLKHLKMLDNIYKKKSYSVLKYERIIDKQRSLRMNNQLFDKERKWRETQNQINHENLRLRNKLLQIYTPKQYDTAPLIKADQSLDNINPRSKFALHFTIPQQTQRAKSNLLKHAPQSPFNSKRIQTERGIHETNTKIYERLAKIQSDVIPRLKLDQHNKETNYFKQMILKSSPKKSMRMKKIVDRTLNERAKFFFRPAESNREYTTNQPAMNPQDPFIFF